MPSRNFPRVLSVQVLRIGDSALVGLPFELTTETGRRIESAVLGAVESHGIEHAVVSSVANEYCGYIATPEEYGRQYYEGGHTLYGPKTQPFMTAYAAKLAGEVAGRGFVHDVCAKRSYSLGVHRYLADDVVRGVERRMVGAATFHDPDGTHDGYWEAHWLDEAPGALDWHEPMVRVEASDDGGQWGDAFAHGRRVDDQWWAIEVRHEGPGEGAAHRYLARWWDPSFAAERRHRFVLEANAGQPRLDGTPFD